jgi:hypothetical protein
MEACYIYYRIWGRKILLPSGKIHANSLLQNSLTASRVMGS